MRNIKELRDSLVDNYSKLKNKEISISECKEMANTAGKIMSTVKYEMEYNKLTGRGSDIGFMNVEAETEKVKEDGRGSEN